ncbi:MAG: DUF502 domain-containing protein, partial [Candidatus Krumholzibacteria bacterium]|nr:DUF502 domain-containing protein [Candidatus Krumholzibacteria bacterium]
AAHRRADRYHVPKCGSSGLIRYLRRRFLAGVLILTPTVVTGWIFWKVFSSVDNILAPLQARYPIIDWPGVGFVVVLILILLTGIFAGNFIGRRVISQGERVVYNLPLIRRIYTAVKEISEVFLSDRKTVFREVVLIRYPHKDSFAMAFVTREGTGFFNNLTGKTLLNVFVPTTPNPTSGFLLLVPEKDVIRVPIKVEEGLKMVISGGAFTANAIGEKIN